MIIREKPAPAAPTSDIERVTATLVTVDGRRYELQQVVKDGFDLDAFASRYTDILAKYDYIVGDWGYDQLRLRGFYANENRRANKDQLIRTLADYLYEYCNFGCAYFVLARLDAPPAPDRPKTRTRSTGSRRNRPHGEKAGAKPTATGNRPATAERRRSRKRRFAIQDAKD